MTDWTYAEDGHSGFCCEEQERRERVNETGNLSAISIKSEFKSSVTLGRTQTLSMVKRQVCDASVSPDIHRDLESGPHVSRLAVVGVVGLVLSPHPNLR